MNNDRKEKDIKDIVERNMGLNNTIFCRVSEQRISDTLGLTTTGWVYQSSYTRVQNSGSKWSSLPRLIRNMGVLYGS